MASCKKDFLCTLNICVCRVVAKISSLRVYAISRKRNVQLGSSLGSIFLLFRIKVAGPHAHSYHGKIPGPWFLVTTLQLVQKLRFPGHPKLKIVRYQGPISTLSASKYFCF